MFFDPMDIHVCIVLQIVFFEVMFNGFRINGYILYIPVRIMVCMYSISV